MHLVLLILRYLVHLLPYEKMALHPVEMTSRETRVLSARRRRATAWLVIPLLGWMKLEPSFDGSKGPPGWCTADILPFRTSLLGGHPSVGADDRRPAVSLVGCHHGYLILCIFESWTRLA